MEARIIPKVNCRTGLHSWFMKLQVFIYCKITILNQIFKLDHTWSATKDCRWAEKPDYLIPNSPLTYSFGRRQILLRTEQEYVRLDDQSLFARMVFCSRLARETLSKPNSCLQRIRISFRRSFSLAFSMKPSAHSKSNFASSSFLWARKAVNALKVLNNLSTLCQSI